MDLYFIVKYLHVLFVITWLGGGLAMVILGARASRANDDPELGRVIQDVIFMANRVFIPAALAALACGLILALIAGIFSQIWIIIGLCGFALTFGLGIAALKPRSDKVGEMIKRDGITPAVVDQSRQILHIAQFDIVMLFVVVADMVLKPALENYITLLVMIIVLAGAAYYFLADMMMPAQAKVRA
jgi:uncharacterized membrane protein